MLRRTHKLRENENNDFEIRSQEELATTMTSVTDILTILLGAIAGISLLVGGIGIMNIMYVSVTERTREIRLRMSIGGRGVDILLQFLIESIMFSVFGGLIGIMLGFAASSVVGGHSPAADKCHVELGPARICCLHRHRGLLRMVPGTESCGT